MTSAEVIASSTALADTGGANLVQAIFAFFPVLLKYVIPLALVIGAYYYFSHRAHAVR